MNPKPRLCLLALTAGTLALTACGKQPESVAPGSNATAAAVTTAANNGTETVVYFCNWSEYLDATVLEEFSRKTGVKVVYSTYDSNEALYAKLKLTGGNGCDLVVPSTYFISKMTKEGLLAPLDRSRLPNFIHLDAKLLDQPYDPGNAVSVPYMWGLTAIAVNSEQIDPKTITGWADLWKPEFKGKVLLQDDVREVFGMALRTLGHSGNSTDPLQLQQALEKLERLKPSVVTFNSESPKDDFLQGNVQIGMMWNGEAYQAQQENPGIAYVYPKEGAILWIDSLAIPKNAAHPRAAHALIDFLLDPEISRRNSEAVGYGTPNLSAQKKLDPAVAGNPVAYPGVEVLKNAELQIDVGEAITEYERLWEQLKGG